MNRYLNHKMDLTGARLDRILDALEIVLVRQSRPQRLQRALRRAEVRAIKEEKKSRKPPILDRKKFRDAEGWVKERKSNS